MIDPQQDPCLPLPPDPLRPAETDRDEPVPQRNGCALAFVLSLAFWVALGVVLWRVVVG